MKENMSLCLEGFFSIHEPDTKKCHYSGTNKIHLENMTQALGWSVVGNDKGFITGIGFGNGATVVDQTGVIRYLTPNTSNTTASLYNQTFFKSVSSDPTINRDISRNYIETRHVSGASYTDVFVSCVLDYGEPANQQGFDISSTNNSVYVFDEIGLFCKGIDEFGLLTHAVFHPVQKALNILIQVDYTIRIHGLTSGV